MRLQTRALELWKEVMNEAHAVSQGGSVEINPPQENTHKTTTTTTKTHTQKPNNNKQTNKQTNKNNKKQTKNKTNKKTQMSKN